MGKPMEKQGEQLGEALNKLETYWIMDRIGNKKHWRTMVKLGKKEEHMQTGEQHGEIIWPGKRRSNLDCDETMWKLVEM